MEPRNSTNSINTTFEVIECNHRSSGHKMTEIDITFTETCSRTLYLSIVGLISRIFGVFSMFFVKKFRDHFQTNTYRILLNGERELVVKSISVVGVVNDFSKCVIELMKS